MQPILFFRREWRRGDRRAHVHEDLAQGADLHAPPVVALLLRDAAVPVHVELSSRAERVRARAAIE